MYSLILKITHNTKVKDTIAIARGAYKIIEGTMPGPTNNNIRTSSWMDNIIDNT